MYSAVVCKMCSIDKFVFSYHIRITAGMDSGHLIRNSSIFNMICWFAGTPGQRTQQPSVCCSKYYFFFTISCKILCKNCFNLFFLFIHKFTKTKIKSFESPKSKPATHCYIFNLSKLYLDHQLSG